MKKFFTNLKVAMTLLLLCGVCSAWAEDVTIEINTSNSGVSGSSYASKTFTVGKVQFGYTDWLKSTNIQAKKNTSNSLYNVDAIPGKIKSITFVQTSTSTARAIRVYGGTSSKPTTEITAPKTDATMTFDFSDKEYTYFSMSTPGNACYFDKITITYEKSTTPAKTLTSIAVSGSPTKTTYVEGDTFDPSGLVVTGTYSDSSTDKTLASKATWTVTPSPLTVGATSVNVIATVDGISSDVFTVEGLHVSESTGKKLVFDLSENNFGLPTSKGTSKEGDYTYTLDNVGYVFSITDVQGSTDGGIYFSSNYVMTYTGNAIGLPAIENYKLTKVVAENSGGCSTSVKVGICGSASSADYITGGAAQIWTSQSTKYTYDLSGTEANTSYYLYVTSKNAQIVGLELTYEKVQTQDVTISSVGYATACIPFDATVEGAKAYYVTIDGEKATLNEITGTIPAETGIILKGSEGLVTFTESAVEATTDVTENCLVGSVEGKDFADDDKYEYYIFANDEANGLGFYKKKEDGVTKCAAGKAVLAVPAESATAKSFFLFDETVGIENVNATKVENPVMYNLAGQRVTNAKGIVIINGKKVIK